MMIASAKIASSRYPPTTVVRGMRNKIAAMMSLPDRTRRTPASAQDDSFHHIAQGYVVVLCKSFEHLENTFFHPYTGLYAFHYEAVFYNSWIHGTNVLQYLGTNICKCHRRTSLEGQSGNGEESE